ncbi:hypothetical protein L2E82_41509 [Cichorium intybus]|uniref:Uncharacterized protein n=1 Tax=Cichorium intybus TaxID=13427 RepID=A0ACB9AN84_CICIN|nr:hypothetical protein L2E82_41509 [Cichorium intybus]
MSFAAAQGFLTTVVCGSVGHLFPYYSAGEVKRCILLMPLVEARIQQQLCASQYQTNDETNHGKLSEKKMIPVSFYNQIPQLICTVKKLVVFVDKGSQKDKWVEFTNKVVAKRVASMLNGEQIAIWPLHLVLLLPKSLLVKCKFVSTYYNCIWSGRVQSKRVGNKWYFSCLEDVSCFVKGLRVDPKVDCYDLMSTKNIVHLAQIVRDGVLAKYDYGNRAFNLERYGVPRPPIYNISNIPKDFLLFLSYGGQDALFDPKDVATLLDDLKLHDEGKLSKPKPKKATKEFDTSKTDPTPKEASTLTTVDLISSKQMAIEGFKAQSEMVSDSRDRLITTWEARKESVIVEGVHLSLNFVPLMFGEREKPETALLSQKQQSEMWELRARQKGRKEGGNANSDEAFEGLAAREPPIVLPSHNEPIDGNSNSLSLNFCSEFQVPDQKIPLDFTLKTSVCVTASSSVSCNDHPAIKENESETLDDRQLFLKKFELILFFQELDNNNNIGDNPINKRRKIDGPAGENFPLKEILDTISFMDDQDIPNSNFDFNFQIPSSNFASETMERVRKTPPPKFDGGSSSSPVSEEMSSGVQKAFRMSKATFSKRVLEEALSKVEAANGDKLKAEEALRKWRTEDVDGNTAFT